jgi:hypothetical protein
MIPHPVCSAPDINFGGLHGSSVPAIKILTVPHSNTVHSLGKLKMAFVVISSIPSCPMVHTPLQSWSEYEKITVLGRSLGPHRGGVSEGNAYKEPEETRLELC